MTFHYDYISEHVKAKLRLDMHDDHVRYQKLFAQLSVQVSPFKSVCTTAAFNIGDLVLVPTSTSVIVQSENAKAPGGGHACGMALEHPIKKNRCNAFIMQKVESPEYNEDGSMKATNEDGSMKAKAFVVPFYYVRTTPNRATANMRVDDCSKKDVPTVPLMKNTKKLEPKDELFIFKEIAVKQSQLADIKKKLKKGRVRKTKPEKEEEQEEENDKNKKKKKKKKKKRRAPPAPVQQAPKRSKAMKAK